MGEDPEITMSLVKETNVFRVCIKESREILDKEVGLANESP